MQTMVPLYGFGGGSGGTGATLTVTAPAGATVTVTKDGKTKTKVADSSGLAVFKGLASGEWTISITDGEQTAQKTVTITADYSTAITFFSAIIHITYPEGSTCTATDGTTTLTAPDTSGTWECVVPNAGTWTIKFVDGETEFYSKDIDITENEQSANVAPVFLYYYGNQCTGITGGWTFGTNTWEESNRFKMQQKSGDYASGVVSNESIDLSGKTLYVDVEDDSVSSSQSRFNIYVNKNYFSLTFIPVSGRNVMPIDTTNANKGTITLEYAGKVRDYTSICYVYRMWLE